MPLTPGKSFLVALRCEKLGGHVPGVSAILSCATRSHACSI